MKNNNTKLIMNFSELFEYLTKLSQYFGNFEKTAMRSHNKTFFGKIFKVWAEFSKVLNLKSVLCQNLIETLSVVIFILLNRVSQSNAYIF